MPMLAIFLPRVQTPVNPGLRSAGIPRMPSAEIENRIADQLAGAVKRDVAAAFHFKDLDPGRLEQMRGVRIPSQRHDGKMFEQQQHIVRQAARNAILGERTLPLQRFLVRDGPRLNDTQRVHAVPVPLPSSPLPWIAHRVAKMPSTRFSRSQTLIPTTPKNLSMGAARKPIRIAPTAASTAITPCCQMFSSW